MIHRNGEVGSARCGIEAKWRFECRRSGLTMVRSDPAGRRHWPALSRGGSPGKAESGSGFRRAVAERGGTMVGPRHGACREQAGSVAAAGGGVQGSFALAVAPPSNVRFVAKPCSTAASSGAGPSCRDPRLLKGVGDEGAGDRCRQRRVAGAQVRPGWAFRRGTHLDHPISMARVTIDPHKHAGHWTTTPSWTNRVCTGRPGSS